MWKVVGWHVRHCARWRGVDSGWKVGAALGSHRKLRPVVPVTTSSPRLSFRARSSHCQVLALPQSHSPEGGTQRCQITPGEPTPRLPGVCGCTCVWSALRHTGAMWVAVERCRWKRKLPLYRFDLYSYPTISLLMIRKDDGCGVVLPLGLQPYSSPYVIPFPHAILDQSYISLDQVVDGDRNGIPNNFQD